MLPFYARSRIDSLCHHFSRAFGLLPFTFGERVYQNVEDIVGRNLVRSKLIPQILPGKLTWNPKIAKMEVRTMIFLFNHVIFRFHVSFRGCMPLITLFSRVLTGTELLPAKPLQVVKPSSEGFVGKMIHLSQKHPANSWWLLYHHI